MAPLIGLPGARLKFHRVFGRQPVNTPPRYFAMNLWLFKLIFPPRPRPFSCSVGARNAADAQVTLVNLAGTSRP